VLSGARKVSAKRDVVVSRENLNERWAILRIIDVDTGRVLSAEKKRLDEHGEIRLSTMRQGEKGNHTGGKRAATIVFNEPIFKLMTSDEYGTLAERSNQAHLLLILFYYADRKTGRIRRKRKRRNGDVSLQQKELAKEANLSEAYVSRTLKKLVENGVLEIKDGFYYLVGKFAGRG
jgi:CRP-like cAMP-binding protein